MQSPLDVKLQAIDQDERAPAMTGYARTKLDCRTKNIPKYHTYRQSQLQGLCAHCGIDKFLTQSQQSTPTQNPIIVETPAFVVKLSTNIDACDQLFPLQCDFALESVVHLLIT
jgi:hypothetical protein